MSMFNVNSASFHQVYVSGAIDLTGSINLTGSLLLDGKQIEVKRKSIHLFRTSDSLQIPNWAEKITVYAIGAGGGGGGGASGYAHSSSISFEENSGFLSPDILLDKFLTEHVSGTPGNYTPRQDTIFGHEFVTGGGGGAGGCIVINLVEGNDVINARGNFLQISIGAGGLGGSGSSYFDDVVAIEHTDKLLPFYNENYAWRIVETIYPVTHKKSWPGLFTNSRIFPDYSIISPYGELYNGKPGGDTIVSIGNKKITQAQGGNGGTAGFALKKYYDTYHRFCGIHDHQSSIVLSPGGANDGTSNFPNNAEIRIGGPGGYGISMPSLNQYQATFVDGDNRTYPSEVNEITFAANVAPDIPFRSFSPKKETYSGIFYADNVTENTSNTKLPYGNTNRVYNQYNTFLKYQINGNILPTKAAPTGGGGGVGASFQGLDQRDVDINDYMQYIVSNGLHLAFTDATVPNDFFKEISNRTTGSITFGFGGVPLFDEHLIDDFDENGNNFKFPSSTWNNYVGGSGGYGNYGTNTDTYITDWSGNPVGPDVNPSSGLFFAIEEAAGFGGGGGAGRYVLNYEDKYRTDNESLYPTRGQNGANGQDGAAIVVIE